MIIGYYGNTTKVFILILNQYTNIFLPRYVQEYARKTRSGSNKIYVILVLTQ